MSDTTRRKMSEGDIVTLSSDGKEYEVTGRVSHNGVRVRQCANHRVVKAVDERSVTLVRKAEPAEALREVADIEHTDEGLRELISSGIVEEVVSEDGAGKVIRFPVSEADRKRHEEDEAARLKEEAARVEELRDELQQKAAATDAATEAEEEARNRLRVAEEIAGSGAESREPERASEGENSTDTGAGSSDSGSSDSG